MNSQIENLVNHCTTCSLYNTSKSKNPLQPPPLPTKPWEKVGSDLFEIHGQTFIIITDYLTLYPEVYYLPKTTAIQVIEAIKDAFARHGIPSELVSDNGPQYKSHLFRKFATEWEFTHSTSSPYYPRSNGLAESSVKTIKRMMMKCIRNKEDVKKSLLVIRNTPLQNGMSPAEMLMGRKLQEVLPSHHAEQQKEHRNLKQERQKQKLYHDRTQPTTAPSSFTTNQPIAVQHHATKEWSLPGSIVQKVAPRSYTVKLDNGTVLRRNVKDIRKVHMLTAHKFPASASERTPCEAVPNAVNTNDDDDETIA